MTNISASLSSICNNHYHGTLRQSIWYHVLFTRKCTYVPFLIVFNSLFINSQEWAEEEYPTYANGPGYIISSDIAQFIVSNFEEHKLKVRSQMNICLLHQSLLVLSILYR